MSHQKENANAQNVGDASEETDKAYEAINIPVSSVEIPELDQTGDNAFEVEASSMDDETYVEELREQIESSLFSNDEGQSGRSVLSYEGSDSLPYYQNQYVAEYENVSQSDSQYSHSVVTMPIMDDIKYLKKSLKATMRDSVATVKIVLIPVGQEIIWPFKVDTAFKYLKDNFSHLLNIPPHVLQLRHAGIILKNNETLLQYGVKPQDVAQVEIFSTQPDQFPVKRIHGLSEQSQIITVNIQTGTDEYQEVAVEIIKSDFHKPFLGGFRHKITGIEYHNAGTQTVPKKIHQKTNVFNRDTQTVFQKKKQQQTRNTTSTQMTKIGVYVSNMTDKLVTPGNYISAEKYHAQRLVAVIIIQTYYRQWHAKRMVENIRRQKMLRLKWEAEEEERKKREKEELMQMDYYRRHNPQTKEDFELLYNALELWRQEELARINQCYTGAERKARLCDLLEKESQLIASIERHRYNAYMANKEAAIQAFLDKCSAPKTCKTATGNIVELDTQFTIRARELQTIYKCIMLRNISQDERLDVLLTLKHTMKEHDCKLTQEILELIDREVDLMMRGVKHRNLEGLRKRIATLFFHYIKTPLFNPEVVRHLKLQDIQYLTEKIWASQSVLSAWNDLDDLVMVRWDKNVEWSPWNCILLTKDEGAVHLKLASTEEGYEPLFIHKIKHKHFLAKNYFSQIPLLASFILDGGEVNEIRRYHTEKTPQEPYL